MIHLLYHWIDIDGLASAAVVERFLIYHEKADPATLNLVPVNYNDFRRKLAKVAGKAIPSDRVWIVDMNVDKEWLVSRLFNPSVLASLKKMAKKQCEIVWFDHHLWTDDVISKVRPLVSFFQINSGAPSACHLIKEKFLPDDEVARGLSALADETDRFMWLRAQEEKKIDWSQLHWQWYLISESVTKKLVSQQRIIDRMAEAGASLDSTLQDMALKVKARNDEGLSRVLQKTEVRDISGLKASVTPVYSPSCKASLLGLHVYFNTNADLCVMLFPNGVISIRSAKGLARNLALKLGGGGHQKAAGAQMPFLNRLFLRLFRVYPTNMIWKLIQETLSEGNLHTS